MRNFKILILSFFKNNYDYYFFQFIVGFFSFLILLCCEGATAGFRAALVPIHASFGLTTFMLAIAAALTGLQEKVWFSLRYVYTNHDHKLSHAKGNHCTQTRNDMTSDCFSITT